MHKKTQPHKTTKAAKKTSQPPKVRVQRAPIAKAAIRRNTEPIFRTASPGCILVSKTEYVGEVVSDATSVFRIAGTYPINARSAITFPWLSNLAGNFESYRFKKLIFHYESEAPTVTPGYVGLVVDYNPADPPPTTKMVAMDFEESIRGPVWTRFSHVCTSKNLNKRKSYFNRSSTESPFDPALYDVGTLYMICGSNGAAGTLGELWVEYECELITPELDTGATALDGALKFGSTGFAYPRIENEATAPKELFVSANGRTKNFPSSFTETTVVEPSLGVKTMPISKFIDTHFTPPPFKQEDYVTAEQDTPETGSPGGYFRCKANSTYIMDLVMDIVSSTGTGSLSDLVLTLETINGSATITVLDQLNKIPEGNILKCEVQTHALPVTLAAFVSVTVPASFSFFWSMTYYIRQVAKRLGGEGGIVPTSSLSCYEISQRTALSDAVLVNHRSKMPSREKEVKTYSPPHQAYTEQTTGTCQVSTCQEHPNCLIFGGVHHQVQ